MSPEISVIIPIYNVASYIEDCLVSLVSQSFPHYELVLVDDCSSDNSISLARKVLTAHPNVSFQLVTHLENRGLSAARNTGIQAAKGKFLVFADSDDWLPQNALEILYREIVAYPESIVCGNTTQFTDGVYSPYWSCNERMILDRNDAIMRMLTYDGVIDTAWAKIYQREIFIANNIEFPEGLYFEDTPTNIQLFNKASTIIVLPENVYFYRRNRPGSILQERSAKSAKDRLWVFGFIYDYLVTKTSVSSDFALNYYTMRLAIEYRSIFTVYNLSVKQQYELSRNLTSVYYRLKRSHRKKNFRKEIGYKLSFLLRRGFYRSKMLFILLHNSTYSILESIINF